MSNATGNMPSIPFLFTPAPNLLASGMPDQRGLQQAATYGVKRVINLCPANETPPTEPDFIVSQGMDYQTVPIAGPGDLNRENVEKLAALLDDQSESTLIHCGSSNRVGAMLALKAFWVDGKSAEEALQFGLSAGLTKLEPLVKQILQQASR